uniref:sushi, von Willebrand factor type A, EGF and pentraxin domain-containing protein 1-like n=1 Tax=Styela clava TaxID=7725 RepID=UPI00193AA893|nr:sushi, von Willebrand factor type A, EGF and pentraxin domain-containing protein 1-like [Styela clava]
MLLNKKIVAVVILICVVCLTTSQDCPKNEAAAIADDPTRLCRKECSTDADCTGTKSCLCDDLCGKSCYNPDYECPDLTGTLTNGIVSMPDGRKYGAKAKHTCGNGYYRVGEEKRICRSTGKWSHVQTNCTRGCDLLPTISGAYADTDPDILGYQPGETVTYACNTGYEGAGDFTVTCLSEYEWSTVNFYCQRKSCGAPETISNGAFTGTSFLFGDFIIYYCNTGYVISGTAVRECMADAVWEPEEAPPSCNIDIECDFERAATPTCGYTVESGTFARTYRDADGSGFPGFVLAGNGKILSGAIGLAGNEELCMSVDIKDTSNGELVANAYNEAETKAIWPFSASTNWKTEKFKLKKVKSTDTEVQLELVASGNVELDNIRTLASADCNGLGTASPCAEQNLDHGTISPEKDFYIMDEEVSYSCDNGYTLEGGQTGTCKHDGTWTTTPFCKSIDIECDFESAATPTCGYTIESGTFARTYRDADSTGFPGFVLAGNGKILSGAIGLAGNEELCMSVDIKDTSNGELVANAYNEAETKAIWRFSASINWKTEKFKLKKVKSTDTEVQLELVASGNVELDNIKTLASADCNGLATPCAKQNLDHGKISPEKDLYIMVEEVSYTCDNGYILEGGQTGTCKQDGSWTTTPFCK